MKRMTRSISRLLAIIFLMTSTILVYPVSGNAESVEKSGSTVWAQDRDKTEIIVKYKTGGKQNNVASRIKSKRKLTKFSVKKSFQLNSSDLVEIDKNDDIDRTVEELRKDPDVEYAQPNYKLDIAAVPADARFTEQWGLYNNGQEVEGYAGRSGVDINALNAWNITRGSSTTVIGLLDTGLDINHQDLKNSIYVNPGEIANNGIDDDRNGYIDDVNGWDFVNNDKTLYDSSSLDLHGTQVAGVIAAGTNSLGISGAAPGVKILPLKFINGNWGYTCDAIDAIEYAMAKGVKIMNCSFGGTDNNFALKDTMVNSGILFICSGGNRGADVSIYPVYPACFDIPNVLSVASLDSKGVLSPYSSFGGKIHIAAPGVNILSTTPDNTYGYFSGTSASAPFVTGAAALLKSYLPSLSFTDIAARIKNNAVPCTNLAGKIYTGGRVDAFAALTNTRPQADTYTGPGNDNGTVPGGQQGGNEDTWYTQDQLAKIKEKLHYGESGVNPASGNYSFTVVDMSVPAPGFQVNISRSYNSRDGKNAPFGQGWTFGFEGRVEGADVVSVGLPNGSYQRFRLSGGTYTPEDNRSTFIKNTDGTYLLTTKDQYKYYFNTGGYLVKMEDRNGNVLVIQVDSAGKVLKITDTVGRVFNVHYGSNGMIDKITDPGAREVKYEYDSNNRLVRATDPKGGVMRYFYDSWGFINEIQDHNQKMVEKITYNHAEGENQHKVSQATDALGDTVNYSYDMTNRKTTVTDMNRRVSTYWFDSAMFTTQVQDPEGKSAYTEYYMYGGTNKYGDVKSATDRNGNKTLYEVDGRGNVIKVTNPDGGARFYEYDDKNNLVKETDEAGRRTYYVYDANKVNLVKKVQPLNGTDPYTGTDNAGFAVTLYVYYAGSDSGSSAKGLLRSQTDPEGNTAVYTYDADGNVKTTSDPETGKVTANEYNRIGWKTASTTPKGNRTEYTYDKNGQLIKTTAVGGQNETIRSVYNLLGQKVLEISPNQYDGTKDDTVNDTYSGTNTGTAYTYYDSGSLKNVRDALGNTTGFTYDVYGNKLTETRPNGSVYRYEYDVMNRVVGIYFKDNATAAETLLAEYSYAIMGDGRTQTTETKFLNSSERAVTVSVYDYANRLVEKQNPDGTKIKNEYNPDGSLKAATAPNGSTSVYKYDGMGRLSEQWAPFELSEDGNTLYTYSKTEYYKNGWKYRASTGKDKVLLNGTSAGAVTNTYEYYKNGKLKKVTDAEGRKTGYLYDDDGNITEEDLYTDPSNRLVTEYTYNHLGKVETKVQRVKAGDIYGNAFGNTGDKALITAYTYDRNGNVKTVKTPDGTVTTYTYDELNRRTGTSSPGLDEAGNQATIQTGATYDWEGKPLTTTDANANATSYTYSPIGLLVRLTDANRGVTLYSYDTAGRKTAEVSPKNYDAAKSIAQMNRVEYIYDLMGRLKVKKDIYFSNTANDWVSVNTGSYVCDNSGNVVKELDASGYDYGAGDTPDEKINTGYGTEYVYNFANKLVSSTDPVSKERALPFAVKYEYDGLGRKISETNTRGVITEYAYNDAGNIIRTSVKKDAGSDARTLTASTYDLAGRELTHTDANGNTVSYEYNEMSMVRKTVYPGDATIPFNAVLCQYDVMGNLTMQSDSTGAVELYTYDSQGRQLAQTQQKSNGQQSITTSVKYDKNGNQRYISDGKGAVTEKSYDSLNRLTSEKLTVGGIQKTTSYGYDANGNRTTVTDWLGNIFTDIYDPLNRLIEKRDPYTTIQKLEYNKSNVQEKSYDALGNLTRYIYDKNNRLIAAIDPEGHTTSQSYDDIGNIKAKTDGRSITTTYNYDEYNRLASVVNAKSETTSYTYDLNGNMLSQTDGNGNTTSFEYNAMNKQAKKIDQGGKAGSAYINAKTESYAYNADGSTKTMKDRNGITTSYEYDIHGRLLSRTAGNEAASYTYDNNGNQLTMTDSTGTTERTYDEQGRVTSKTVPVTGRTTFTYDTNEGSGCYSETTADPKGNSTKKVYDKAGRLQKVIADGKTTEYTYYANGSRKSVAYPDGAKEEYTYYADGLNKTLVNKKANGTVLDRYSYTYDGAHNQTSKTDSRGVTSYTYDSLERLESTAEPNGRVTSYTHDRAGNRLTETVSAGTSTVITTYTYNEQNRLMSTISSLGSTTETVNFAYDNNGNMVSKSVETVKPVDPATSGSFSINKAGTTANTAVTFYRYDVWSQMIEAVTGDKTEKYVYNGEGYRVAKTDNGQITRYLYEADKVILETNATGNQTARNVYGTNLLSRKSGNETVFYMYNGHPDVTALIDNMGTVRASYYYDAFGNIVEQTGNFNNSITYAGYQYDKETGLYYLNSRMYDPKIARFMQEDTFSGYADDPLSLNLYTYCANNPIIYADPSGHKYYVDENGVGHVSDITITSNTGLNPRLIYDNVIISGQNVIVSGLANAGIVNINSNSKTTFNNSSTVNTFNIGSNANTTINNNEKGKIDKIKTGTNSVTVINNGGYIGSVNTGISSTTTINNVGTMDIINTGIKSTNTINNTGTIKAVLNSWFTETTINNTGNLGIAEKGRFFSSMVINDADVKDRIYLGSWDYTASDNIKLYAMGYEDSNQDYWSALLDRVVRTIGLPVINSYLASTGKSASGRELTVEELQWYIEKDDEYLKEALALLALSGGKGLKSIKGEKLELSPIEGTVKTGDAVWDMTKGGKTINGRWYSEHSLERMAPDTPQVRAELEARALDKGLQRGTEAFNKYVDPRGIPPSVIDDAIQNGTRTAGKTAGTWVYEGGDVRVIVNNSGGVVTVIPK